MRDALEYYLGFMDRIDGWFDPEAARIIYILNEIQKRTGISGNIFEIGVHHGRMTMLLALLAADGQELRVCDIFRRQELNESASGSGSLDIFMSNWRKYVNIPAPKIYEMPSSELSAREIGSNYRIFAIDGGHTADETYGDLSLAAGSIIPEGIIIIDDYFDQNFPGVSEGVNKFLSKNGDFLPLAMFFNKMAIVRRDSHHFYRKELLHNLNSDGYLIEEPVFYSARALSISRITKNQRLIKKMIRPLKSLTGDSLKGGRLHRIYKNIIRPRG